MKPILQILHSQVLPWTQSTDHRIVVARPVMRQINLPAHVTLEHRPLKGKRTTVKKPAASRQPKSVLR